MRLFRLFAMLDDLRLRHLRVTARHLSQESGRSLRTICRDIADLKAMGAPIRGEGGAGYVLEKGYFLPSLHFDADALEALCPGAGLVAARWDGGLADAAAGLRPRSAARRARRLWQPLQRPRLQRALLPLCLPRHWNPCTAPSATAG